MEKDDTLVAALAEFAADLLSYSRYEPFVRAIVDEKPASWQRVADLVTLPEPIAGVANEFFVMVAQAPGPDSDPAYRSVIFVCREPWFGTVALYNTAVVGRRRLSLHRDGSEG